MEMSISHVFNIENITLPLDPGVMLVTGKNSTGKSSVLKCFGAVACHEQNPSRIAVSSKTAYLKDGTGDGMVQLKDDDGQIISTWDCSQMTIRADVGVEPIANPYTAGLVDFIELNRKRDRQKDYIALLGGDDDNPIELLRAKWIRKTDGSLEAIIKIIQDPNQGWDVAEATTKDRAREAKSDWTKITGQPYGVKIATVWTPDGYLSELEGKTIEFLQGELNEATAHHQALRDAGNNQAQIRAQQAKMQGDLAEAQKALTQKLENKPEAADTSALEAKIAEHEKGITDDEARLKTANDNLLAARNEKNTALSAKKQNDSKARIAAITEEIAAINKEHGDGGTLDLEKMRESLTAMNTNRDKLKDEIAVKTSKANEKRAALESAPDDGAIECPHCQGKVVITNGTLVKAEEGASESAKEKLRDEIAALETRCREIGPELENCEKQIDKIKGIGRSLRALEDEAATLKKTLNDDAPTGEFKSIEQLNSEIEAAENAAAEIEGSIRAHKAAIPEIRKQIAAMEGAGADWEKECNKLRGTIETLEKAIQESAVSDSEEVSHEAIAQAAEQVNQARINLEMQKKYLAAQREHQNVVDYTLTANLLGAKGVRLGLLNSRRDDVREKLAKICELTGWETIKLTDSFEITVKSRPAQMCADNEKYKAQWAMQAALAMSLGEDWVVFDAADIVKDESWNGLVKLANALTYKKARPNMRVIIGGTSIDKDSHPDDWIVVNLDTA